jgi:hypothetical protein
MKHLLIVFIVFLFFMVGLPSCGGRKEESTGSSRKVNASRKALEEVEAVRDKALQSKTRAKKGESSKYASKMWQDAESEFQAAEALCDENDYKSARSKYVQARNNYSSAVVFARVNKRYYVQYSEMKSDVLDLLAEAQKQKAAEFVSTSLDKAKKDFNEAEQIKENDIKKAQSFMRSAYTQIKSALSEAKKEREALAQQEKEKSALQKQKKEVLLVKKSLMDEKKIAEENRINSKFPDDFQFINNHIKRGDTFFENGGYQQAEVYYKEAKLVILELIKKNKLEPKTVQEKDTLPKGQQTKNNHLTQKQVIQELFQAKNNCDLKSGLSCVVGSAAKTIGTGFAHTAVFGIQLEPEIHVINSEQRNGFCVR